MNADDLVLWICTLDNGKFRKYKDRLMVAFKQQGVDGKAIKFLDKQELRGFGIDSLMDRGLIHQNIQSLLNNNINDNPNIAQENEGQDGPAYVQ